MAFLASRLFRSLSLASRVALMQTFEAAATPARQIPLDIYDYQSVLFVLDMEPPLVEKFEQPR